MAGSELPLVSIDRMQEILSQAPASIIDSFEFPDEESWKMHTQTEQIRCQFHQHFVCAFFVQKCFVQLFFGYILAKKSTFVQKNTQVKR